DLDYRFMVRSMHESYLFFTHHFRSTLLDRATRSRGKMNASPGVGRKGYGEIEAPVHTLLPVRGDAAHDGIVISAPGLYAWIEDRSNDDALKPGGGGIDAGDAAKQKSTDRSEGIMILRGRNRLVADIGHPPVPALPDRGGALLDHV